LNQTSKITKKIKENFQEQYEQQYPVTLTQKNSRFSYLTKYIQIPTQIRITIPSSDLNTTNSQTNLTQGN